MAKTRHTTQTLSFAGNSRKTATATRLAKFTPPSSPVRKPKPDPLSPTKPGTIVGNLLITSEITRTNFSLILAAESPGKHTYVLKKQRSTQTQYETDIFNHISSQSSSSSTSSSDDENSCDNIMQCKGIIRTNSSRALFMKFELMTGSLNDFIKDYANGLPFNLVLNFTEQTISGLKQIHNRKVIHHDIKPSNILIDQTDNNYKLRITDFGVSKREGDNKKSGATPQYAAPEYMLGFNTSYAFDLWSLGCVIYKMHTGKTLFNSKNPKNLLDMYMQLLKLPNNPAYLSRLKTNCNSKASLITANSSVFGFTKFDRIEARMRCDTVGSRPDTEYSFMSSLVGNLLTWQPAERATLEQTHQLIENSQLTLKT